MCLCAAVSGVSWPHHLSRGLVSNIEEGQSNHSGANLKDVPQLESFLALINYYNTFFCQGCHMFLPPCTNCKTQKWTWGTARLYHVLVSVGSLQHGLTHNFGLQRHRPTKKRYSQLVKEGLLAINGLWCHECPPVCTFSLYSDHNHSSTSSS